MKWEESGFLFSYHCLNESTTFATDFLFPSFTLRTKMRWKVTSLLEWRSSTQDHSTLKCVKSHHSIVFRDTPAGLLLFRISFTTKISTGFWARLLVNYKKECISSIFLYCHSTPNIKTPIRSVFYHPISQHWAHLEILKKLQKN